MITYIIEWLTDTGYHKIASRLCSYRGHSPIWYVCGDQLEPDMHCKHCLEDTE